MGFPDQQKNKSWLVPLNDYMKHKKDGMIFGNKQPSF